MDIAIEEGRALNDFDWTAAKPVTVISRSLARTLWGDASAVGREFEFVTVRGWQRALVVGVAEDVRSRVIDRPALEVYVPYGRGGLGLGSYVIKHAAGLTLTDGVIRAALQKVDPDLVVDRVQTTRSVIDTVIAPSRLLTTAMGAAVIAASAGAIGLTLRSAMRVSLAELLRAE